MKSAQSAKSAQHGFVLRPGSLKFRHRQPFAEPRQPYAFSSLDEATVEMPLKPVVPEGKARRELTATDQQCEMVLVGLVLSKVGRMNEMFPHLGEEVCCMLEAQLRAAGESAKNVGEGMSPLQEFMARAPFQLFGMLREQCRKLENSIA